MNYQNMNNYIISLTLENKENYNEFIQEIADRLVKNYFPLDEIESFDELNVFKTVFMDNFVENIQTEAYLKIIDVSQNKFNDEFNDDEL